MATAVPTKSDIRRVVFASVIGATIEWYDFFLYGVVAGIVFNKLFFPTGDAFISTLLAYTTFAVGFVARPLGGVIFGHFGDKIGRKSVLVMTLLINSCTSSPNVKGSSWSGSDSKRTERHPSA